MPIRNIALIFCALLIIFFSGFKILEDCTPITSPQMRAMLDQLGYKVSDLNTAAGKEKYSVTLQTTTLDVPIGVEISPSKKIIWFTVFLSAADSSNTAKNYGLLKQNGLTQPAQFYVTSKGNLMMGLPVENRGITNATLREKLELVATKVSDAKYAWQ